MYRAAVVIVALTFFPSVAAAQQPCTTDANQVVNEAYRHVLERGADSGSAHWVQQLQNGATVRDVVREIGKSPEHTQRFWVQEAGEETPYIRAVGTIYRHILGRQPDPTGAREWAQLGARAGAAAVIDRIVQSPEYNAQFGDWGVPGSGGLRYCGRNNQGASAAASAPVTAAEERRFRGMDRNGDGIITRAEWRGNRQSFNVHDWNNDGVLSGDEVRAGAFRSGSTLEAEELDRHDRFEFLDANNNNRIEPREWHNTVTAFNRLDVNNDNVLSRSEFVDDTSVGAAGTAGELVVVDPTRAWTDTGFTVRAGETILIDADGAVRLSDELNDIADPSGSRLNRRAFDAPLPRTPAGGLIARVGNSDPIFIGNRTSFRAPASGRLYFGVNDDFLGDNTGEFRVNVDVR